MPRTLSEAEYTAIGQQVLSGAPAGLTKEEFDRWIGPRFTGAVAEAEQKSPAPEGSAAGRFLSGAGEMLNPISMLTGAYQAIRHPYETGASVLGSQMDQLHQAAELARGGRYVEAAGHGAAGLLPMLGPAAAGVGEQLAHGDVAGGLGAAAGLMAPAAAPGAVGKLARSAPGLTERAAAGLTRGSSRRVVDVIAPKMGREKTRIGNMAEKVAPVIAANPELTAWSRAGVQGKIDQWFENAAQGLDTAADARLSARTFDEKPIIEGLLEKRRALTAEAVEGSRPIRSVVGGAVREVRLDPMEQYALRWMKDEMESVPFSKRNFTEVPTRHGGQLEVTGGSAGAPIYRAVVGAEGNPLIHASRRDVIRALNDEIAGKPSTSKLRELVRGVASDLAKGDRNVQKLMLTSGPIGDANPLTSRLIDLKEGVPADMPARVARPIGFDIVPGPNAPRVAQIDQAINELRQLGPVVRYEPLRRMRAAYDIPAKIKYHPSMVGDFLKKTGEASGAADVTDVIRTHLATFEPATAVANADYSLAKTAKDVLRATEETERTRPKVGRQIMARFAGSLAGGEAGGLPGAVAGYALGPALDAALTSGLTTKLQTARLMTKLAGAIRGGELDQIVSLTNRLAAQGTILGTRSGSPNGQ